jgi:hypothetical protein
MRYQRSTLTLAKLAIAASVVAGTVVAAPNSVHDMSTQAATGHVTTVASTTTPGATPNSVHDM